MTTAETIDPAGPRAPPRRACFSFAAYAKAVIEHIRACRVPVAGGLTDEEFAAIESAHGFDFPPDLRSILREGLPIGTGFPNWRSASPQQLSILLALPVSGLLHEVSKSGFWSPSWGPRFAESGDRIAAAKAALAKAPTLVPIYRHFYISSVPNLAGNPVFHVRGGDVRCVGFDLADFFQRKELSFQLKEKDRPPRPPPAAPAPTWAAKTARRVEVWTDIAEAVVGRGGGAAEEAEAAPPRGGLEGCLREMAWRLREGGWREEEVAEMMAGGSDGGDDAGMPGDRMVLMDRQSVMWHVRLLALTLLRAGWSTEDVVDSMGCCSRSPDDDKRKSSPTMTWQVGVGPTPNDTEISMELA